MNNVTHCAFALDYSSSFIKNTRTKYINFNYIIAYISFINFNIN